MLEFFDGRLNMFSKSHVLAIWIYYLGIVMMIAQRLINLINLIPCFITTTEVLNLTVI